jgi:hypothetical protein
VGENARLVELEMRVRAVEDQLEIIRLLSSYGPLVDSGSSAEAVDLWVRGGGYDFGLGDGQATRVEAPQELATIYESDVHMKMVGTGVAHLTATPRITVTGDEAEAVGCSFVVLRENDRWYLRRSAINCWLLVRTASGWRIKERHNRLLDGSPESRQLMLRLLDVSVPVPE